MNMFKSRQILLAELKHDTLKKDLQTFGYTLL